MSTSHTFNLSAFGCFSELTIFAIKKFSDSKNFDYVSTAGGAFLSYLGGDLLPAIEALKTK